ncbi:Aste57867_19367 [Aphanomyces stellatus]|uniref:Aste57867_19367 protein n=1 Tax=Aphanomyces stellatus TaxID=120398 RepID=A0A485LCJ1_9STRA|nr:hypothetical protein As57867_019303 [Aphanomyces stellatus]VFT96081.1 Aste57867_19367 [Aphanomyces stellatus]
MSFPVVLHVYDLTRGMARQMSMSLLGRQIEGVWHTGVFVYGQEYFFGGGIQAIHPSYVVGTYGQPVQTLTLGSTEVPAEEFAAFLREVSPRFTAATYNLLSHNCNNFSNEVAQFLLGTGIPQHILDLPNEVLSTPMGAMFRPMIENMQASMARSVHDHSGSTFSAPTPPAVPISTLPVANVPKSLASYTKPIVSSRSDLHFGRILRLVQASKAFTSDEAAAFSRLASFVATDNPDVSALQLPTDRSIWWTTIQSHFQQRPDSLFPALCLLRVVLAVEASLSLLLPTADVDVVAALLARVDGVHDGPSSATPSAHRILLLSVLVNGLVAPATSPRLHADALRFLPFVWSTWHGAPNSAAPVAAAVVFNLCRAPSADEILQLTLVGGCAEVLDVYAAAAAPAIDALAVERLVTGLGLLLREVPSTRALAAEVGLVHVLSRLKPKAAAAATLIMDVLALI